MRTVNMHEAKTTLSKLVEALESGAEDEILIARNGKVLAKLVVADAPKRGGIKLGLAKGKYIIPDDIDVDNELIRRMFEGEDDIPEAAE